MLQSIVGGKLTVPAVADTIALDNVDSGIFAQTTAVFSSFNHTVTSNSDGILLCGVSVVDSNLASVSSITYDTTQNLSLIAGTRKTGSSNYTEIWGLLAPHTGTHPVVVTLSGAPVQEGGASCVSLTGVHQSLTPDAVAITSGTTGTYTQNITTVADNAWAFASVILNSATSPTATSPTVLRWAGGTGRAEFGGTRGPITPAGSTAITFTGDSNNWTMSAASFAPGP